MIVDLVPWADPILYQKALPYKFGEAPIPAIDLANSLIETMIAKRGIGLAAPQVGVSLAVFVLWGSPPVVAFNPRIVDVSKANVLLEEACLSYPGITLKLKRPSAIRARYQIHTGETVTRRFEGLTARCFQHEYDHLQGIPFFSTVSRPKLDTAVKKANKIDWNSNAYSVGALLSLGKNG